MKSTLLFGSSLLFSLLLHAMASPLSHAEIVHSAHVEAELLAEVETLRPGSTFWTALRMKMEPGWHTYWKNPGDSGLATSLSWMLPEGFEAGKIHWPYPERIVLEPLVSYGYEGEVFLLIPIRVPNDVPPGSTQTLLLEGKWLACEKICIPGEGQFSLTLPVLEQDFKPNAEWARAFAEARAALPLTESRWEIHAFETPDHFRLRLIPPEKMNYKVSWVYFFPDSDRLIQHAAEQKFKKLDSGYDLLISKAKSPENVDTLQGVLVSDSGWRGPDSEKALAVNVPLKPNPSPVTNPEATEESGLSLGWALLFAFTGGLILNLMPCVLPVLSIKILNFVTHAHHNRLQSLRQGLFYSLGVLISFWILAGGLLLLKAGGAEIGWGFQLQSPLVVLLLLILFFVFALNLFDVYEIGTSLTRVGNIHIHSQSTASFLSGILATTVATPCTAPFMGTALGYGLTQSATVSLAVFTALGLGMAFPYLLLSAFPSLIPFIPKPGRWMITLKRFFGILLFATCLWLFWVLYIQAGAAVIPPVLFGLAFIGSGAWIYGNLARLDQPAQKRKIAVLTAVLLTAAGFAIAAMNVKTISLGDHRTYGISNGIPWQRYSDELLEKARREGHPVFIDFTAAWCLTCQVNERLALNHPKVTAAFEARGIVPLKADWTSRDEKVSKALASYGRSSIPLYVYYPQEASQPILLPELITPEIVLDVLEGNN